MTMTKNQPASPAWIDDVHPGTILLFRFPERHDDLAGKKRPCVVLATQPGPAGLQIALGYGTSAKNAANRGFDINVESDDCEATGIHRATRFVLARRITVAAADLRFDVGEKDNPIIGKLLDEHLDQFRALTGFLGDRVFEDSVRRPYRRPSFKRRRDQSRQAHARTVSDRREITTPMRASRRDQNRSTRTVIVEHRRKRGPRPNSTAA